MSCQKPGFFLQHILDLLLYLTPQDPSVYKTILTKGNRYFNFNVWDFYYLNNNISICLLKQHVLGGSVSTKKDVLLGR